MDTIEYRLVAEFPAYRVGSDGSVWSSKGLRASFDGWYRLKTPPNSDGYPQVLLSIRGSKQQHRYVHCLVLEAFIGPCPDGMEACHNNGIPADNRVGNLRWDTHASNLDDVRKHGDGYINQGMKRNSAVLTEEQVIAIRFAFANGVKNCELVKEYRITKSTISKIVLRKIWKHI
jgi:HNH endonuclease